MRCPHSEDNLTPTSYGEDVAVNCCSTSKGMYLDAGGLHPIQTIRANNASEQLTKQPDRFAQVYEMARHKQLLENNCPQCH